MRRVNSFIPALLQQAYNTTVFATARLRARFWSLFMQKVGKGVYIMEGCKIYNPQGIEIGDYSGINHHTDIGGRGGLRIGKYVMIGPYCQILTALHQSSDWNTPICRQGIYCHPVIIEDDVWVGTHAVILPDVTIGRGAIIGAGAVVTHNVEPYAVMGGVPARLIKYRFTPRGIQQANRVDFRKYRR